MKYYIYDLRNGKQIGGAEEVQNVGWKPGAPPFDMVLLSVDDGKCVKHMTLGEGFEITIDVVKP